jgi:uncharacterized protein (TIGR00251 family)
MAGVRSRGPGSPDALLRFRVRAKPGARRDHVGGSYGGVRVLIVAVRARAVEGAANDAVVALLASAFGVARRDVTIERGERSREKSIAIAGDVAALHGRLEELLDRE